MNVVADQQNVMIPQLLIVPDLMVKTFEISWQTIAGEFTILSGEEHNTLYINDKDKKQPSASNDGGDPKKKGMEESSKESSKDDRSPRREGRSRDKVKELPPPALSRQNSESTTPNSRLV